MSVTTVNGYSFAVNDATGSTVSTGDLQGDQSAPRNGLSAKAGGSRREPGDQGGHLIAAQHNGASIPQNLFAQDGKLNQGAFRRVENAEKAQLKDGAVIQTERIAHMTQPKGEDGGCRPEVFLINDTITYKNGETQNIHLSFTNLSPKDQADINAQVSNLDMPDMPNPGDELRGQMTPSEYADLMEATDKNLPGVKEEFNAQVVPSAKMTKTKGVSTKMKASYDEKGAAFRASLRVDAETIAACNKTGLDAAKASGKRSTSSSKDDGGYERGDSPGAPGSLGRGNAYKGGTSHTSVGGGKGSGLSGHGGTLSGGGKGGVSSGGHSGGSGGGHSGGSVGGHSGGGHGR